MVANKYSVNLNLAVLFELDTKEEVRLQVDFVFTEYMGAGEEFGVSGEIPIGQISDDIYWLNGKEVKLKDLNKKYSKLKMERLLFHIADKYT